MLVLPTLISFFYIKSINGAIFGFLVLGSLFSGHSIVNFIYMMEFVVKRERDKVYATCGIMFRLAIIFAVIYFRFISKSWKYWIFSAIVVQICVICAYFWFPESPDFYFAKGRFEKSKLILLDIARFNGVKMTSDQLEFTENNTE